MAAVKAYFKAWLLISAAPVLGMVTCGAMLRVGELFARTEFATSTYGFCLFAGAIGGFMLLAAYVSEHGS